jgi:hypothetical protein
MEIVNTAENLNTAFRLRRATTKKNPAWKARKLFQ